MRAFARTVSIRAPSLIQKIVTICVVHATALTVAACIDEPASPPGIVNLRNMASVGPGELLLSTGGGVWRSAAASDSAGDLIVARATILGTSGDSIAVRLVADEGTQPQGPAQSLITIVNGTSSSVSQAALKKGQLIYRFTEDRSVQVEYRLKRGRDVLTVADEIQLVQSTNGQVISANTPWVFGVSAAAAVVTSRGGGQGGTTCPLNAATGACDSVQWTIVPYASGLAFPGFQSDAGSTGPSHEISLTFSSYVSSISVKVNDPTWVGNKMIAYDGSRVVDTAAFVGNNLPGFNDPSTRTISSPMTRVVLIPAPNDYVTYEVSILIDGSVRLNVSCTPAPVMRTATVTCTASLSNNKAFSVILATVDAPDGSPVFIAGTAISGGKAWQTQGPGLYATTLSVSGLSGTATYGGTGYVTISPRTFPAISFPALPTERKAGPGDGLVALSLPVGPFPMRFGQLNDPAVDTLGMGPVPVVVATSGPSVGYATVGTFSLPLMRPEVLLNPTLFREGVFYADQNGHDGLSDRNANGVLYCNNAIDTSWVDRLMAFVRRHEGMTAAANSHYGIWMQAFQTLNPMSTIEALVFPANTPPAQVKDRVIKQFEDWSQLQSVDALHDALNAVDANSAVFDAEAGCALDRDLTREKGS